jgi:thiol:disulfide interchange protein DsbD
MKRTVLSVIAGCFLFVTLNSQVIKPVKWTFSTKNVSGELVDLIFKATIASPWHMYGLNIPANGPIPASIHFSDSTGFEIVGKPSQSPKPEIVDDKIFNMKLELHNKQVTFTQRIRKTSRDSIIISGNLDFMTCSDMQCVMGDNDFVFRLNGSPSATANSPATTPATADSAATDTATAPATADSTVTAPATATAPADSPIRTSLWGVFFLALLAGLAGLLTPCVYPMIPMTVSYFLRGNKPRSRAITEAMVFGLSIVFLYTMIGVLVAIFKNPNAVNNFTTHWITNLVFFLIFIALSASFFGMFEITLPSSLANKVDREADKGGYLGAFFMALAMAILSFSCTGPIVASLLIKASQGAVLEPVIGMAGFSLVFALPFTLFAIFPSWLQGMPKSGSWLNAIKVFFAFIMLAFSIYFLGKIDQSYHLNILNRSLFLSLWIVNFALLGLYLIGKIRFTHDSDLPSLGFPRLIFAMASFAFSLYLFTGFFGSELKSLSTILPPDKSTRTAASVSTVAGDICEEPKYADVLELPYQLQGYFDYNEALACAREKNKPLFVDFVGHTCSNCKKMYSEVWSDPRVLELLRKNFIIVALYTDDKTKLPEKEWITSAIDGKVKSTMGKKNQDFQIQRFRSNALPMYAIVDADGKDKVNSYYTYDPDVEKLIQWLKEGSAE